MAADLFIDGISKRFGEAPVLRDVTLHAEAGEFVSLLGPSGCGKSTLLRIIAGLERADSGRLRAGGADIDHLAPKDRELAFVFQSYALYPHLTVRENIAAPLVMRELSDLERMPLLGRWMAGASGKLRSIDSRVRQTSELLRLDALLDRYPGQLSGGQRQRVALGRALVRKPRYFLMDEPLANLDAGLRIHTRGEIARLHREMGTTTLFVTHDQAEATALSDRVAVMFGGEIRQLASPFELYADPVDIDVARFLTQPFLNTVEVAAPVAGSVTIDGQAVRVSDALAASGAGTLAFRPEHAKLSSMGEPGSFSGHIDRVEHAGTDANVFLRTAGGDDFVVRATSEAAARLSSGEGVGITVDPERAWFFPKAGGRRRSRLKRAA